MLLEFAQVKDYSVRKYCRVLKDLIPERVVDFFEFSPDSHLYTFIMFLGANILFVVMGFTCEVTSQQIRLLIWGFMRLIVMLRVIHYSLQVFKAKRSFFSLSKYWTYTIQVSKMY